MRYTTIDEIHGSPWGVVAHRRDEIEQGAFGVFDRVLAEEIAEQFPSATLAARIMKCSKSTARRWLDDDSVRFIVHEGLTRYCREDVERIAAAFPAKPLHL